MTLEQLNNGVLGKPLYREAKIEKSKIDLEKRIIREVTFSSNNPVLHWFGYLILDHSPASIRMERWEQSPPFLYQHDPDDQRGVIQNGQIKENANLIGDVLISRNPNGADLLNDIYDGIRPHTSFGFVIYKVVEELDAEQKQITLDEQPVYRAIDWEPMEGSSVSMPRDLTVGVFRSLDDLINTTRNDDKLKTLANEIQNLKDENVLLKNNLEIKMNNDEKTLQLEREAELKAANEKRAAEIKAIAEKHKLDYAWAISSDVSVDAFKNYALDFIESKRAAEVSQSTTVTDKELKNFSLTRLVFALAENKNCEEKELCDQYARDFGLKPKGIMVPHSALVKRDLTAAGTGTGLEWTTKKYGTFIEALTEEMFLPNFGLEVLPLSGGSLVMPKDTTGSTFGWATTETGDISESTPTTAQIEMTPKRGGTYVDISKTLQKQSAYSVDQIVINNLIAIIGEALQTAVFKGSGSSGEPTGIAATSGINSITGTSFTYATALQYVQKVLEAKVKSDNLAFFMIPEIWAALASREKVAGYPQFIIGDDDKMRGYRCKVTNLLYDATYQYIVFGDMSKVSLGLWDGVDLLVDPYVNATKGLVRVYAHQYADVAVKYPGAFSVSTAFS